MSNQLRARASLRQTVLIGLIALALMRWAAPAGSQNTTLVSFTATSFAGQPDIYVAWETATQFGIVGFFVVRSDFNQGPYVRVSEFIPRDGDNLTGWQYDWIDETPELWHTYYYRLEEITADQISIFYGPIVATAGSPTPQLPFRVYLPLVARSG
jgi:hypothetical protein